MTQTFKRHYSVDTGDALGFEYVVLTDATHPTVGNFYVAVDRFESLREADSHALYLNNINFTSEQIDLIVHLDICEDGLTPESLAHHIENNSRVEELLGHLDVNEVLAIANAEGCILNELMMLDSHGDNHDHTISFDTPLVKRNPNYTKEVVKAVAPSVIGAVIGLFIRKKMVDNGMYKSMFSIGLPKKPGTFTKNN